MKPRDERILWLFGTTVAVACALGLVLLPAAGAFRTLRQEFDDARGALAVAQRSGATFETLQRTQTELDEKAATLDALFVTRTTAVGFLADLEALGNTLGVEATPTFTTEPTPAVQMVPLQVTVVGPLDGVLRYLEAIATRSPVVIVNALALAGSSTLTLTLHAEVAWR